MCFKKLMDTACNRCRSTKDIQNICHNTWRVSTTSQENKMLIWIVRLMIGTGGLICEQSRVTLDQINGVYTSNYLEFCQPFQKGW